MRRRLWVLAGLVAVIAIIALVIWKPGSTGAEPREAPAAQSTSVAKSTSTPTPSPGVISECADGDVLVEALTDKSTYGAEELPQLSLQITNTTDEACRINVGTAAQVFTIKSGSDVYWTSTDCQVEPADAIVELEAGQVVASTAPITWDRTRSTPSTCEGERPAVPAAGASYHLSTSVGGFESEASKQFILAG
ncbi:hypothetical protein GCM10008097_14960 [Mycetocola manganoxydans]|nr:hypothetical protein GCM10008097_14960 [Mycetocola manganoxydans]